jgi:plasmid stabilization system protein ParE
MTFDVVVEPRAERDIRTAAIWILGQSTSRTIAVRWVRSLRAKIASLRINPRRCPIDPDSEMYGDEVRVLLYGRRHGVYRVLFAIREQTVHVLTVRHSARARLTEDPDNQSPSV